MNSSDKMFLPKHPILIGIDDYKAMIQENHLIATFKKYLLTKMNSYEL